MPANDTGVDLLVTHNKGSKKPVTIQVKHSRSYGRRTVPREEFRARGWFTINRAKARKSRADWWIFVISYPEVEDQFIIIPKRELVKRIGKGRGTQHLYLTYVGAKKCFDTRGLPKGDLMKAIYDGKISSKKDWSGFVDNWKKMLPKR